MPSAFTVRGDRRHPRKEVTQTKGEVTMSTEDNKAAERRWYEEVWGKHNLAVVDELVAPDVVEHNPLLPGQGEGREGYKQTLQTTFAAFPDVQSTIEELLAEGDLLVVRWIARGTHRGAFLGIPPTNQPMTSSGIDIIRYREGKRVETWRQWDALGMMQQLGVAPPPPGR
jgi:steroid delta-isomerase-like uncharacterized protein